MGGLAPVRKRTPTISVMAAITTCLVGILLSSGGCSAHLPEFNAGGTEYDDAQRIDDIMTSMVFYGRLDRMEWGSSEGALFFEFDAEAGQELSFKVGTEPYCLVFPGVLVVGPDLPFPDDDAQSIIEDTGLALPDGLGAVGWEVFPNGTVPTYVDISVQTDFEPFTQTLYQTANSGIITIPSDGTYFIVLTGQIVPELVEPGSVRFFLATGSQEEFALQDFALLSWYWFRVQIAWRGIDAVPFLAPMIVIGAASMLIVLRRRRPLWHWTTQPLDRRIGYHTAIIGASVMIGVGANEMILLAVHLSHWDGLTSLVLGIQTIAVALGVLGLMTMHETSEADVTWAMTKRVLIGASGILIGAGILIGPVLFILGSVFPSLVKMSAGRMHRRI